MYVTYNYSKRLSMLFNRGCLNTDFVKKLIAKFWSSAVLGKNVKFLGPIELYRSNFENR